MISKIEREAGHPVETKNKLVATITFNEHYLDALTHSQALNFIEEEMSKFKYMVLRTYSNKRTERDSDGASYR